MLVALADKVKKQGIQANVAFKAMQLGIPGVAVSTAHERSLAGRVYGEPHLAVRLVTIFCGRHSRLMFPDCSGFYRGGRRHGGGHSMPRAAEGRARCSDLRRGTCPCRKLKLEHRRVLLQRSDLVSRRIEPISRRDRSVLNAHGPDAPDEGSARRSTAVLGLR
jgi:hypothetical protein